MANTPKKLLSKKPSPEAVNQGMMTLIKKVHGIGSLTA